MNRVCRAALICLLCALPLRVSAATTQEYDRALASVQTVLVSQVQAIKAEEVPSGESASLVARQTLGTIHSIEIPGHAPILVDSSRLIAAVQSAEAIKNPDGRVDALKAVGEQITLLRVELEYSGTSPGSEATVQSARAVLARSEFASEPLPPPSLADRIAAWLSKVFPQHQPTTPNMNMPSVNPNIILGILIVIAAGAFAVLVAVIVQAIGRRAVRSKSLALDEEESVLVEARDNNSLLALAEQQAKAGDFRHAFRLVYLAALVALDTGGVLRFDRSKTNWEYLRALRASGRGDIYQAMTPLTREFDQVWYGFAHADASHYARALAQYQALLAAPQGATNTTAAQGAAH